MDRNLERLTGCRTILIIGHNEYWTNRQRASLIDIAKKQHWSFGESSVVENSHTEEEITVDKTNSFPGKLDEYTGLMNQPWDYKPAQSILGVSYEYGGYPVKRMSEERALKIIKKERYENSDIVEILAPDHEIFKSCQTRFLGKGTPIISVEIDGIFITADNMPDLNRVRDIPRDIKVLAKCDCWITNARVNMSGIITTDDHIEKVGMITESVPHENGGIVISIGTVGWLWAAELKQNSVYQVTCDTIKRLNEHAASSKNV